MPKVIGTEDTLFILSTNTTYEVDGEGKLLNTYNTQLKGIWYHGNVVVREGKAYLINWLGHLLSFNLTTKQLITEIDVEKHVQRNK
jgi:hypothetical protein